VGRGRTDGRQGVATLQVPRGDYWILARQGGAMARAGVERNWNPATPIRIVLPRRGNSGGSGPPPPPGATLLVRVQGRDLNAPISVLTPLGGAQVTVHGKGKQWSGKTAGNGHWSIKLPPGQYRIDATAPTAVRPASIDVVIGSQNVTRDLVVKIRVPQ